VVKPGEFNMAILWIIAVIVILGIITVVLIQIMSNKRLRQENLKLERAIYERTEKANPADQSKTVEDGNLKAKVKEPQMSTQTHMSYLPNSISDSLPAMVKVQLIKMTPEQQALFVEEYRRKKKSTGLAYVLWFVIGLHYVYLGKVGWQFFYWLTIAGLFIWGFIDLFRIHGMVRNYNKDIAMDIFRDLKMTSS
jgi:TM2 domain-containing membrane protein YozV